MSDFRVAYSKLIRAVWADPGLQAQIQSNPALLKSYGFSDVPSWVSFKDASGKPSIAGYDQQVDDATHKSVTFYIPPKPGLGLTPGSSDDPDQGSPPCCCCCPPCCSCCG
ncbi:hypothetical protein ACVWZV_008968 [Bradyrhizobium sp. GM5.1]